MRDLSTAISSIKPAYHGDIWQAGVDETLKILNGSGVTAHVLLPYSNIQTALAQNSINFMLTLGQLHS